MNLSEFRKNKYGDTRQTTFIGAVSGISGEALEAAHENAQKQAEAQKAASSPAATGSRFANWLSGTGKSFSSGYVNAAGMVGNAASRADALNTNAEIAEYSRRLQEAQRAMETAQDPLLKAAYQVNAEQYAGLLKKAQENLLKDQETEKRGQEQAQKLFSTADNLSAQASEELSAAKEGVGAVGGFLMDAATAGTHLLGDMALNMALPGAGLASMGVRSFGSSAQQARQNGADELGQWGYGLGSAATSVLTEKLSNVAAPFKKAFGTGVLEKAIPGVVQKLSGSAAGKLALSMLSEGGEEMIEDLLQPVLQRATYDPEALVNYKNADYWTNMLYDGLVGAALGGVGAGVEQIGNRAAGNRTVSKNTPAGDMPVDAEGNSMGAPENAVQVGSEGIMEQEAQRLFGQQKTASTGEAAGRLTNADNMLRYRSDIDKVFSGKYPSGKMIQVGDTPELLTKYGANSHPMTMTQDTAYKIAYPEGYMGGKHNLGMSVLKQLPYQVENPLAILKSNTQDNSLVLLTAWKDGEKSIIIPLHLDKQGAISVENRVASAYQTGHIQSYLGVEDGNVLYTRNNEDIHQLLSKGVQFPQAMADDILAKNNIPQEEANRNRDILSEILFGGKRTSMNGLSAEQQSAVYQANEAGKVGMDSAGKIFAVDPAQHIDQRGAAQIADRNVNAFQYDHPQLHAYYKGAAEAMLTELSGAVKGGETQTATGEYGQTYSWRNKRNVSPRIASLLDGGMTYSAIEKALDAIIHDKGQENYANAKRVEMVLDDMLTNGYNDGTRFVPANQQYIAAKDAIAGSQADSRGHGLDDIPVGDGLGNANAGTVNTAFDDMQARSDSFHPVNPNSEQRIMNDQQRAPSEVPTVNPDTGKNIGKTVSTILNSPLTSPEMATQIESAVADGQFDYIPVTDRDANLKAQQDLSSRGLQTVADSFIAKVELGQRITKNDTASAIAAYNQAVADGNHALAFDLMTAIADAAHDSAQVVQSMNLMNRLTPEGRLLTLRKYVDKLNRQQSSKTGRQAATANATQEQVDAARTNYVEQATGFSISDELAANYLMAETDAERAAAWDAITTDIANQIPSTFREKANFWRYTSMLLNPTTHVRNFMGNAIQAGARTIKNGVGAVIERAVVKDASQRTKSVVLGKEGKALRDFAKSQYEADKSAAMGAGKYSDASAAGINREIQDKRKAFQGSNPLSKAVQAVGDFNTRLLDAEDVLFNKSAYVDSFAQALQAKGVTAAEAAGGAKADLVAKARAYAIEEAQKATYRNTTALSEALSKMGRYEGDNAFLKAMSVAADAFMPFRRTPANILTTGMDYSPVGLAKAITYDAYQVKAGNMSAADMVDHLSAGLTGTGILALGAYLAAEGLLKVRTGDDDREKDYNKDRGMQDYSLQIGDKSYTLDWAVPAAMPLFAGAAIMESAEEGGSGFDAVMDAMGGISEVVLETSMLSSLNDLISNWSYADNKALYLLDRTATSYAGQYVPTVGGKIASAMDDTVRKSYVEKGTGQLASDLGYFAQSMEKKIPGARETLQPKVDLWGNEVSNGEVGDRLLQNFLSPGYFKTVDTSAMDKELRRLAEATGSSAVYPAEVEKSFKVGKETKNLTAEEYTKYAKAVGQARYQAVSALTGNSGYKKLTDEEKAKAVAYAYEYATVKGKQAVSSYKPGDSSFAKGAMNSVLPIDSYILYKINADIDGNGSVSRTESAKALQSMSGLTDKQRWQEWARLNDAKDKADKASAAGLTVGEYASMKENADANGDGRVTKEEAMKALGSVKNRVDLWDIICTTGAKNPYK